MTATKLPRLPAVFFGHGNPMLAIADNVYTAAWRDIAQSMPKPTSIVAVSAHWLTRGTAVTAMKAPPTIHDFGGFPQALFDVQYPAPGDPALAVRLRELLAPVPVALDQSWGLDHGVWSVLRHAYPDADVPVVQLSIDATQPPAYHFELGRRLAPLRDEGVLVIGTGNVVHNLRMMSWGAAPPHDWAVRFNDRVRDGIERGDLPALVDYTQWGEDARLSVPSVEHYLPLLYVLGTWHEGEPLSIPVDGIDGGAISMMSVVVGG